MAPAAIEAVIEEKLESRTRTTDEVADTAPPDIECTSMNEQCSIVNLVTNIYSRHEQTAIESTMPACVNERWEIQ
jgi:hypothetical protein